MFHSYISKKNDNDILKGPILPQIMLFVLPLMFTNLLQVFYSAADMIVVGLSEVPGAIGSIGTTNALINFFVNLFSGFAVGTTVVVAKNIGANKGKETEKAVHSSVVISLLSGIICGVLGFILSKPILVYLGDEGGILRLAVLYTRIYFVGAPFLSVANSLIAVFRAKGDTKTPLFILSLCGLLNVLLNLFFVLVCKMSVDGVAIATVISNGLSAFLLLVKLSKLDDWCRFDISRLKLDKTESIDIIKNGIPAAIQGMCFSFSNMLIQSSIIGLNNSIIPGGSAIIDGNAAATSVEGFLYTACNSVYQATVTFVSQHFGARKFKRINLVVLDSYLSTTLIALVGTCIVILFQDTILGFYISDPLAIDAGKTRFLINIMPYFLLAWMEVGSGVLRGLGKSMTSTIISLTGSCIFRIFWISVIFPMYPSLETVYLSYPISWGLTGLIEFIFGYSERKRLIAMQTST